MTNLGFARPLGRHLLLCIVAVSISLPVLAEEEKNLSASVVLVLKLLSKTHVKPTTGIVISDDGLVLVPADIVKEDGEIVVLDNGVDIAVNGRPAVVVDRPTAGGLALLSVKGLKRPGIVLSANALESDQSLHLEAFPPAKLMKEGAEPLWVPVTVEQQRANMRAALSPETTLPFVTGPIIDACGYLAGLSLVLGPTSLDGDQLTLVVFTDELREIFDALQVTLPVERCGKTKPASSQDAEKAPVVAHPTEELDSTIQELTVADSLEQAVAEPPALVSNTDSPTIQTNQSPPSLWQQVPAWLWFLGGFVVLMVVWKGLAFIRLLKAPAQSKTGDNPLAADEPDTTQLENSSGRRPRSAPVVESRPPDMSLLPADCNAVVMIEADLDSAKPFKRYCAVNRERIDIAIGRGDADVNLEHPSISRQHARLMSSNGLLTFSDLGSSNGTFINGTPCLPSEIMYIDIGDDITLGQVQLRFKIANHQTELT